jgi:hypothetical protein
VPHVHQLAIVWPEIFGVLAIIANVVIGLSINRDPKVQLPLTLTAVAITLLAASTLFQVPRHLHQGANSKPATVFYPSTTPPASAIPPALRYRQV